eukprot:jgi/Tetstr1/448434/TSEL_035703.t1
MADRSRPPPSPSKAPPAEGKSGVLGRLGGLLWRSGSGKPPAGGGGKRAKVSLPEGNDFYYDEQTKSWRERGKEQAGARPVPVRHGTAGAAPGVPTGDDGRSPFGLAANGLGGSNGSLSGLPSPAGNQYISRGSSKDLRKRYVDVSGPGKKSGSKGGSFGSLNELLTPGLSGGISGPPSTGKVSMFMPQAALGGGSGGTPQVFSPLKAAGAEGESPQLEAKDGQAEHDGKVAKPAPVMFVPQPPAAAAEEEEGGRYRQREGGQKEGEEPAKPTAPAIFVPTAPAGEAEGTGVAVHAATKPMTQLFAQTQHGHSQSGASFFEGLPSPALPSPAASTEGDAPPGGADAPLPPSNLGPPGAEAAGGDALPLEPDESAATTGLQEPLQEVEAAATTTAGSAYAYEQQAEGVAEGQYASVPYLDADGVWQQFYGDVNSEEYKYYYQAYCDYCAYYYGSTEQQGASYDAAEGAYGAEQGAYATAEGTYGTTEEGVYVSAEGRPAEQALAAESQLDSSDGYLHPPERQELAATKPHCSDGGAPHAEPWPVEQPAEAPAGPEAMAPGTSAPDAAPESNGSGPLSTAAVERSGSMASSNGAEEAAGGAPKPRRQRRKKALDSRAGKLGKPLPWEEEAGAAAGSGGLLGLGGLLGGLLTGQGAAGEPAPAVAPDMYPAANGSHSGAHDAPSSQGRLASLASHVAEVLAAPPAAPTATASPDAEKETREGQDTSFAAVPEADLSGGWSAEELPLPSHVSEAAGGSSVWPMGGGSELAQEEPTLGWAEPAAALSAGAATGETPEGTHEAEAQDVSFADVPEADAAGGWSAEELPLPSHVSMAAEGSSIWPMGGGSELAQEEPTLGWAEPAEEISAVAAGSLDAEEETHQAEAQDVSFANIPEADARGGWSAEELPLPSHVSEAAGGSSVWPMGGGSEAIQEEPTFGWAEGVSAAPATSLDAEEEIHQAEGQDVSFANTPEADAGGGWSAEELPLPSHVSEAAGGSSVWPMGGSTAVSTAGEEVAMPAGVEVTGWVGAN